jgi:hypothetical protein
VEQEVKKKEVHKEEEEKEEKEKASHEILRVKDLSARELVQLKRP